MKFKIELINIGRQKECQKYEQEAEDLDSIAHMVFEKVKRFLLSSNVCMMPDEETETDYIVYAGIRAVGRVKIEEIK